MRLLADENIEFEVVSLLKDRGHDVLWVTAHAPGTDDMSIPAIANMEARIPITYDVDFISAMRLSRQNHAGAVLVRLGHTYFSRVAAAIHETLVGINTWQDRIAVIKPSRIRYVPKA